MKANIAVILSFSLISSILYASTALAEDAPKRWEKSARLGFNLTNGNSETTLLSLGAKADADLGKNLLHFQIGANFGESSDQDTGEEDRTHEDITFEASYKHLLSERAYVGFGIDSLYDDIADIDYRIKLKLSIGYFILKSDTLRLNLEAGPGYVFEEVADVENDYFAPYIAERFEWNISETAKFFESAEFVFDASESENYLINAEAGIEAAISTNLSLVVTVTDKYDNLPAAGKAKNDLSLVSALKIAL